MQYTLRNVPPALDRALRQKARAEGKSLNEVTLDALSSALGTGEVQKRRDLSDLAGTWLEDPDFDAAIAEQDQIDSELWP